MIEINGLVKTFGKNEVLKNLDINIKPGLITAILGPNGSGKTTLIKSILGLVVPDKGTIKINNTSIIGAWEYRKNVGYLPQIARFPENLKVQELIDMVKDLKGEPADELPLITLLGLKPYLKSTLGNLSGGTRQKVNIILTFMFDNPVLILDEPTAGLDPVALVHLKDLLIEEKKKGKTILFTTHIMSLVDEIADDISFLLNGTVFFSGTLDNIKKERNETNLERLIANVLNEKNFVS